MKITLPLAGDSYNTHPSDELEITTAPDEDTVGVRITDSDRVVRVRRSEFVKMLKLVAGDQG